MRAPAAPRGPERPQTSATPEPSAPPAPAEPLEPLEIEHKFLVDAAFDVAALRRAAQALAPTRVSEVSVRDTYYLTARDPDLIFRHRFDVERQELTLKRRDGGDTEVRLEVNLHLDQAFGDQGAAVAAFLRPLGLAWQGALHKDILVFYYPDCEVVYYAATALGQTLRCVEFEALGALDLTQARATLQRYEEALGFAGRARARRSLFDLLLAPHMPPP